ncbi:hypothetical protein GCM10009541_23260 [Micromonospora gifhornensis]|uniref:Uncharacterized protein n=1 Tax=Micromonospora gifhornensis TaxID=84594 RepID=A0ABQ4IHA6_9ACTN|nr:hypothetical protein Vgi01_39770 [Micromonospora gifhornensis]
MHVGIGPSKPCKRGVCSARRGCEAERVAPRSTYLRQVDDILARVEVIARSLDSYAPGARESLGRCDARLPVTPV